jgi:hypothetical protein
MSESTPWIIEDDPLPGPRFELPRLQIIHLMMWMGATAIALLPYRVHQVRLSGMSTVPQAAAENPATMAMSVGSGILSGAYLFVTAAVIVWRRRGYAGPTLPGHYFAYRGAGLWAPALTMQSVAWTGGNDILGILLVVIPQLVVHIVFFIWFLRLARRPSFSPAWRRAFGVTVAAPIVGWVLTMCWMFVTVRSQNVSRMMTGMAVIQGSMALLVALVIVLALRDEARRNADRHWSHLIGAGGRAVEAVGYCLMFLAMLVFSTWR